MDREPVTSNPMVRGGTLAVLAAVLFGVTAPVVKHFGTGVGPFATAAVLYAGAALGAIVLARAGTEPRLGRRQLARVLVLALFGAVLAPAALAWGLQRTSGLAGSLLLNLEALFTVLLALVVYREPVGPRMLAAALLMISGGGVLALRADAGGASSAFGVLAVAAATLGWAIDNTLTRPLADFDARGVVWWKATLGALVSGLVALSLGEAWPAPAALVALVVCGAAGYGVSLRLYLYAQRALGAARTGSLFALAPFIGAVTAFGAGERSHALLALGSGLLFAAAVYLHLTERHRHVHYHAPIEHEHEHVHDDGHHDHAHEPPVTGAHSHRHRHGALLHDHAHASDVHHRHEHR